MADDFYKEFAKVQKKHKVEELTILVQRVHQAANVGATGLVAPTEDLMLHGSIVHWNKYVTFAVAKRLFRKWLFRKSKEKEEGYEIFW